MATITTVKSFMVPAPLKKLFVLTPVTKNIKFLNLISGPLVASQDVRRSGVNLKKNFCVGRRDTKHNYTQNNANLPNVET
jgi:hypothetical protein